MKNLKYATPLFLTCLLILHFIFVILSVMPLNPITNKMGSFVNTYVNPVFTQNWNLFAPDPIDNNTAIQVNYTETNNKKSEWIDVTSSMIKEMHVNYISPYNRISRMPESIVTEMIGIEPNVKYLKEEYEKRNNKEHKKIDEMQQKKYQRNLTILNKYSSSYLKSVYPEKDIKGIKIRILKKDSIPYSQRKKKVENNWKIMHVTKQLPFYNDMPPIV